MSLIRQNIYKFDPLHTSEIGVLDRPACAFKKGCAALAWPGSGQQALVAHARLLPPVGQAELLDHLRQARGLVAQ